MNLFTIKTLCLTALMSAPCVFAMNPWNPSPLASIQQDAQLLQACQNQERTIQQLVDENAEYRILMHRQGVPYPARCYNPSFLFPPNNMSRRFDLQRSLIQDLKFENTQLELIIVRANLKHFITEIKAVIAQRYATPSPAHTAPVQPPITPQPALTPQHSFSLESLQAMHSGVQEDPVSPNLQNNSPTDSEQDTATSSHDSFLDHTLTHMYSGVNNAPTPVYQQVPVQQPTPQIMQDLPTAQGPSAHANQYLAPQDQSSSSENDSALSLDFLNNNIDHSFEALTDSLVYNTSHAAAVTKVALTSPPTPAAASFHDDLIYQSPPRGLHRAPAYYMTPPAAVTKVALTSPPTPAAMPSFVENEPNPEPQHGGLHRAPAYYNGTPTSQAVAARKLDLSFIKEEQITPAQNYVPQESISPAQDEMPHNGLYAENNYYRPQEELLSPAKTSAPVYAVTEELSPQHSQMQTQPQTVTAAPIHTTVTMVQPMAKYTMQSAKAQALTYIDKPGIDGTMKRFYYRHK